MSNRIAIVGMEAFLGPDAGLDAFDATVFDGLAHTATGPPDGPAKARAGMGRERREGCVRLPDPFPPADAPALLRLAIAGALRCARTRPGEEDADDIALILVAEADPPGRHGLPRRTVRSDSLGVGLETARDLLESGEVRGVLVAAVHLQEERGGAGCGGLPAGQGAVAVLLKRIDQAERDQDRLFATIDAVAAERAGVSEGDRAVSEAVAAATDRALCLAGVGRSEVGCLVCSTWETNRPGPGEIEGLLQAYPSKGGGWTCALGGAGTEAGDSSAVSALASLVKAALCLYHRYIPAAPVWTAPRNETSWKDSPFYMPNESRPWFPEKGARRRVAAVSTIDRGTAAHLLLSEDSRLEDRPNRYRSIVSPYCFPIAGENAADLTRQTETLRKAIENGSSLAEAAEEALAAFQRRPDAAYALMIAGHGRGDLSREIGFMAKGVPQAFEKSGELRTPRGSYFTARPLGGKGKVAFVYPGVGSAYVGLGRSLFHLFPELYGRLSLLADDMGELLQEKDLYPRTREPLTEDEIWKRELRMRKDIMTIAKSGMVFFFLFTVILRDIFKVAPHCALGYSLGEPGMFASLGVWEEPGRLADRFRSSPVFQRRLSGDLASVRAHWNLPEGGTDRHAKIWETFTLQAAPSQVQEAIRGEERVYMTIINTEREVVIAGHPGDCRRVIEKLGCKYYPLGLELAIHCDPTRREYESIVDLYTLPVGKRPEVKFYSSSCYQPVPLRSGAVAHSIAKAYCELVDFPRLVDKAYEDGVRLFIELGSRKFCSGLIDQILEGRDHLAMAVNVKGVKDQASLVRVLAQLVGHRVPVDLSAWL
jgi:PfaB family protein